MIHLGGGFTCCLGAVALYLLSRRTELSIQSLGFTSSRIWKNCYKERARIIAVSGRVGSETPLKCEQSGILGVFVQETARQHLLKRNWRFSWVQDTTLMQPMTKEVPWFLDDGTGRVNVAGAQGEIGFALTLGSEVFQKSEPSSFVQGTLDYLKGLKMLGVKRIERILPIGTPLTVVGEAVKEGTGDFRIQKPEQGPFYVSPMPLDQLISKLGEWSRRFKYASMALTVLGVILISKPVIEDILMRRRRRLSLKRVVDAAAKRAEPVTRGLERQHENRSDGTSRDGHEPDICVICLDRKCNTAFVQCGHVCCCTTCSLRLRVKICPLCRRPIEQVLKIYRN